MTLDEIKDIIKEFDQSGLSFLELESKETKIKLKKKIYVAETKQVMSTVQAPVYSGALSQATEMVNKEQDTLQQNITYIKAPLVGVFYERPEPGAKPYVTVGQSVKKGDVVCLIEAMKMINEVTAPTSGIVKQILVTNEALVSFDEKLMEIEEQ